MSYYNNINEAWRAINKSDAIIIGAGAGLTAAGGIDYFSPTLTKKWFPQYFKLGLENIMHIQSSLWDVSAKNASAYYAFWGSHVWHVRYETPALAPYINLYQLIKEKEHFIITTNVDSQFEKSGFDKDKIYSPQGNYGNFQCLTPCNNTIYPNKVPISNMLSRMPDEFHIRHEDIPYCPNCGNFLIPNLRKDSRFVEEPYIQKSKDYYEFLKRGIGRKVILLELGVGFNTPGIIRYPFEKLAYDYPDSFSLIRINSQNADIPENIHTNRFSLCDDINNVIKLWIELSSN